MFAIRNRLLVGMEQSKTRPESIDSDEGMNKTLMFSIIFLYAITAILSFGCSTKVKFERKYDKKNFFGRWEARYAVITNPQYQGERIRINVPRYGWINCQINPDSTFTLDVNVIKDMILRDNQSLPSIPHILVQGGYKMFISGSYEYKDSFADFYNYNHQKHFRSILYTCGDNFYLTYVDKKQNEWELQLRKTN